jgi:5'-3' exonuclease
MGIKDFQPHIRKTYDGAFKEKWLDTYDNLYIDINYVLHLLCYSTETEAELIIKLKDFLVSLMKNNVPTKRLYLIADGVAPMAKMILQRERRINKTNNEITQLSLKLTVGTKFMSDLQFHLTDFVKYIEDNYKIKVIIMFIEPGEGEIKIRKQVQQTQNENKNDTHIVFSSDSDMVMLLMTCDDVSKIYIIIKNKINTLILNVGKLYEIHIEKFGKTKTAKYDFVFLNILMGNDYLPHVSCSKFDNLWQSYKIFSNNFEEGLVIYNTTYIKINKIFLSCILLNLLKHEKPVYVNKFKIKTLFDQETRITYEKYCDGLYWCLGMYIMGYCADYEYIYDTKTKPHIVGVLNTLMAKDTYEIKITNPINYELYGMLIVPKIARKILLSKKQNNIVKQLEILHTQFYEPIITKDLIKEIIKSFNEINENYKNDTEVHKENKIITQTYEPYKKILRRLF